MYCTSCCNLTLSSPGDIYQGSDVPKSMDERLQQHVADACEKPCFVFDLNYRAFFKGLS